MPLVAASESGIAHPESLETSLFGDMWGISPSKLGVLADEFSWKAGP